MPPLPPDRERLILLECRMEQLRAQLQDARAGADHARGKLAEATAREAEHARRASQIHQELADARREIAALHQRLERSDALRAELEGHLFESGDGSDAGELVRLRKELFQERHRALVGERAVERLRDRVEELLASRDILLTRVAEWQQLVREDGPEAADLAGYLSELRREILDLELRNSQEEDRPDDAHARLTQAGARGEAGEVRPPAASTRGPLPPLRWDPEADPGAPESTRPQSTQPRSARTDSSGTGTVKSDGALSDTTETGPPRTGGAAALTPPARPEPREDETSGPELEGIAVESGEGPEAEAPGSPDSIDGGSREDRAPVSPPAQGEPDGLVAALASADLPALRSELLRRLGNSGRDDLREVVLPWTEAADPAVRAAAFEALGRLLERDPDALEPDLRAGLTDPDARVRRRVALAAATARGLPLRGLLGPLQEDPDPQVRRVAREILRHVPPAETGAGARPEPRRAAVPVSVP